MLLSLLVSKGQCFWFHSRRYLFVSAVPQEARSRYDVVLAQRSRFVVHSNVSPLSPFNPFLVYFFLFSLLRLGLLLLRQLVDDSCETLESTTGMSVSTLKIYRSVPSVKTAGIQCETMGLEQKGP